MAGGSLSSLYLDAFVAVAQTRSFSKAAEKLFITQSALSQRVLNLESELEATLFIRDKAGVQLTEVGQELLRYCQSKNALESEFLSRVSQSAGSGSLSRSLASVELSGEIRIGGFSSVMRSVILPALAPLLKAHARVRLNLITREMRELPELLKRSEIDFMILDHSLEREGIEAVKLGTERNVLIQARSHPHAPDAREIFLDHDEEDSITRLYLKLAGRKNAKIERRYLDDVYGLIDGVRSGLGQAVVPRHLIGEEESREVRIVNPEIILKVPVVLHYYAQPYLTRLQSEVIESLKKRSPRYLDSGA